MDLLAVSFSAFSETGFWIGVGIIAGIYAVVALGLQLNVGFTGIVNFGQAAFMAVGAYSMAILTVNALSGSSSRARRNHFSPSASSFSAT